MAVRLGLEPSGVAPAVGVPPRRAPGGLLGLQRTAGNRAVTAMVRAPRPSGAPTVQRLREAATLTQPLLAENDKLQQAFANSPTLRMGKPKKGSAAADAVRRVQTALHLDPQFPLPRTFRSGVPDEEYAGETKNALRDLQVREKINPPSGHEVGHRTLIALEDIVIKHGGGGGGGQAKVEIPTAIGPDSKSATQDREGKLVEKPAGPTTVKAEKAVPAEEESDGLLQGKFQIDYGALWNVKPLLNADGTTDSGGFGPFCESGSTKGALTVNVGGFRLGDRWRLFGSFEVSANTAPTLCGKRPAVEAQIEIVKLELAKWAELALSGMLGVEGPPRGTLFGAGLELEVKPFQKVPALKNWSVIGSANGSYLWQAASPDGPGGKTLQLGGSVGLGVTWDFIPAPK